MTVISGALALGAIILANLFVVLAIIAWPRPTAIPAKAAPGAGLVAPLYATVVMPDGSHQVMPLAAPVAGSVPGDAASSGFATLGFFFPVVGLILYLVWKDQTPQKAHSAGKGALIGVITYFALGLLATILWVVLLASLF